MEVDSLRLGDWGDQQREGGMPGPIIDSTKLNQPTRTIMPSHYESPSANDGGNGKGKSKSSINPTQVIGLDDQDFGDF